MKAIPYGWPELCERCCERAPSMVALRLFFRGDVTEANLSSRSVCLCRGCFIDEMSDGAEFCRQYAEAYFAVDVLRGLFSV